jgi:hypothetical protein
MQRCFGLVKAYPIWSCTGKPIAYGQRFFAQCFVCRQQEAARGSAKRYQQGLMQSRVRERHPRYLELGEAKRF